MCRGTPYFVKVGQKCRALADLSTFHCWQLPCVRCRSVLCNNPYFLIAVDDMQLCSTYRKNFFFRFNSNDSNANALQYYVIRKVPILFGLLFFLRKWPCYTNEYPHDLHFNLLVSNENMAEEESYVYSKPFVLESLKDICNKMFTRNDKRKFFYRTTT